MSHVCICQKVKGVLTIQVKTVFYSIQYKNGCLAASEIFHMLTHSIKFLHIQTEFTTKFGFDFVLTLEDAFS